MAQRSEIGPYAFDGVSWETRQSVFGHVVELASGVSAIERGLDPVIAPDQTRRCIDHLLKALLYEGDPESPEERGRIEVVMSAGAYIDSRSERVGQAISRLGRSLLTLPTGSIIRFAEGRGILPSNEPEHLELFQSLGVIGLKRDHREYKWWSVPDPVGTEEITLTDGTSLNFPDWLLNQ